MIFKSTYPEVEIPDTPLTHYLIEKMAQFGDKPALIDGPSDRTITYNQLIGAIKLVASGLSKKGFKKGDVFAIYSPNLPEYAIAFHAVVYLGGIVTTMNPLYTAEEVAHQLNDAGAKYLLTIPMFLENAQKAAEMSKVEEVFVFGEAEGATPFASLMQSDGQLPEIEWNTAEDLAVLPYSSGTTGLPKGVMLTHRNIIANLMQGNGMEGFEVVNETDTVIGVLPFFHIYGMVVIMNMSLERGATIVTVPRFDPVQFLELIQKHKITRMNLVPPILVFLAKHPVVDKYDLSSLIEMTSGAAPLGEELASAVAERLNCRVLQGYGMTETSPVATINPNPDNDIRYTSAGLLLPNMAIKIADVETQEELGVDEDGEVWMRGPNIMKGYLNNEEATTATITEDGWLRSGDIGHMDEDGHLYIVDRLKELIKYKGFQVAPAELEALLLGNEAVADVAVIPKPDDEAGEIPKAYIVSKGEIEADTIMEWVAEQVAPHKKIREVEFVDEIPKSASGKILRRVLVAQERERLANEG